MLLFLQLSCQESPKIEGALLFWAEKITTDINRTKA